MCADCEARREMAREALLRAKLGEAAGHIIKGAAEMIGIKAKTGAEELAAKQEAEARQDAFIDNMVEQALAKSKPRKRSK